MLEGLPHRSRKDFLSVCESVELGFGDVVSTPGERIAHVYFPTTGFISLVAELDERERLEVGIVGSEGMLGASAILGASTSPLHAMVQGAGTALRMNATVFRRRCLRNGDLRSRLDRYVCVLMEQLAQTAACARFHVVEARLARWLLMSRDRARSDEFHLTHEFLAYMLGVRRVGVTQAARALHDRGLIDYRRGDIAILDNTGLEKMSCKCYARGNEMYEQAFSARVGRERLMARPRPSCRTSKTSGRRGT